MYNQDRSWACHRPVGTGGGCGEGKGPGACPAGQGRGVIGQCVTNPNESGCDEDRHQAPASAPPLPLSLQGGEPVSAGTGFGRQHSLSAVGTHYLPPRQGCSAPTAHPSLLMVSDLFGQNSLSSMYCTTYLPIISVSRLSSVPSCKRPRLVCCCV